METPFVVRPAVAGAGGGQTPDVWVADVVSFANLATLSGSQTIDGISVGEGFWVFLPNQDAVGDRGIWIAKSGDWKRQLVPYGVIIGQGTTYGGSLWVQNSAAPGYRIGRSYYS
jgi:hypothetical protein